MQSNSLFRLANIEVTRRDRDGQEQPILTDLSSDFPGSGITCVVGPSGSGKSTILRLLTRLEDPTQGTIEYRGQDVRSLTPQDLRRKAALVSQTPVMLPGTVKHNLEAGLRLRGDHLPDPSVWLERLGLQATILSRNAVDLSGGEKQRVALARALVTQPDALLLDEVTAALDSESAAIIERLITEVQLPTIWVSHDMAQVRRVANRVYRLEAGGLREEGMA